MTNPVASALFCERNFEKVTDGQIGRVPVAVGQACNVFEYIKNSKGKIGEGVRAIEKTLETAAKNEKLFEYAGKGVNFISKNINPFICVSAGLNVLMADDKDKVEKLVTNTTALTAMFTAEHFMKKYLDDVVKIKGIDKIAEKVMNFAKKYKHGDKISKIISGVAFVTGSCLAYSVGEKFGKLLLGKKNKEKAA